MAEPSSRRSARRLAQTLGGFTLVQMLGFVAPLLALPAVARAVDPAGWVAVGLGQAIGTMGGIVVLFGWWTTGPAEVLALPKGKPRIALYWRSLAERGAIALIAGPICVVVTYVVSSADWALLAVLTAVSALLQGMSPGWFFIASSNPRLLATYETLPRVAASLLSIPVVVVTGWAIAYPLLLIALPLSAYALCCVLELPWSARGRVTFSSVVRGLAAQLPVASSNLLGGLYTQLVIPALSGLNGHGGLGGFVSGDRLYKVARNAIVALGNTLAPWVIERPTDRRHTFAVGAHTVLGVVGAISIGFGLAPTTSLLFGESLRSTTVMAWGFGLGFLFTSISTPLIRNILIPGGARRVPLVATLFAAVTCFALIFSMHPQAGADAGAIAIAASEAVGAAINGLFAYRCLRGLKSAPTPSSRI